MKKLLSLVLSILFSSLATAQAATEVQIVWPFSMAAERLNYTRYLIDQANSQQKKYIFVLVNATGAAGIVAANRVLNSNVPALLLTTPAFFLKPISDPVNSYAINEFKPILLLAELPLAIAFNRNVNPTHQSLLAKSQINFAIGSGLGGTFHAISEQYRMRHPNTIIIPFNTANETVIAAKGGHVDLFIEEINGISQHSEMEIIGITGTQRVAGHRTLTELGYPNTDKLNNLNFIVAPRAMPLTTFKEIQQILLIARQNNQRIDQKMLADFATPINISPAAYDKWFLDQERFYKDLMKKLKI